MFVTKAYAQEASHGAAEAAHQTLAVAEEPVTMDQAATSKPAATPHVGLVCRHCGCRHFHTVYTRRRNDGIIRRKRCRN